MFSCSSFFAQKLLSNSFCASPNSHPSPKSNSCWFGYPSFMYSLKLLENYNYKRMLTCHSITQSKIINFLVLCVFLPNFFHRIYKIFFYQSMQARVENYLANGKFYDAQQTYKAAFNRYFQFNASNSMTKLVL